MSEVKTTPFIEEVKRLHIQKPTKNADYYCITLLGDENGKINRSVQSNFAGFTDDKPRREIREASFVDPEKMRDALNTIKELSFIVNDKKDLYIYLLVGGHGIIEKSLAEEFFGDLIKPKIVVRSYSKGFLNSENLQKQKTNHIPTATVRMNVLKRDNYKCRVCGRSPNTNIDIELHVHHIIPWGEGGITEEDNLITLCHTCHKGLKPHYEPSLFSILEINPLQDLLGDKTIHKKGMESYSKIAQKAYKKDK